MILHKSIFICVWVNANPFCSHILYAQGHNDNSILAILYVSEFIYYNYYYYHEPQPKMEIITNLCKSIGRDKRVIQHRSVKYVTIFDMTDRTPFSFHV